MIKGKYLFIITIIIICITVVILLIKCKPNIILKDTFGDLSGVPTVGPEEIKTCSNNTDIVGVCINNAGCCGSNNVNVMSNSKCYCSHPLVKKCNDNYKNCINSGNNSIGCEDILKGCCKEYSKNDIMTDNFNTPINKKQDIDELCSLTGISNLGERCMELCQTNDTCKAYNISYGICKLFSSVNPVDVNKDNNILFVSKK